MGWIIAIIIILIIFGIASRQLKLPKNFTVVDVETTGLDVRNRIVTLSAISVDTTVQPFRMSYLNLIFNPEKKANNDATRIHGLDNDLLKYQPLFKEHANEVRNFLVNGGMIVAHNAKFDMKFIGRELERADFLPLPNSVFCTMEECKSRFSDSVNLDAVAARIGLARTSKHHNGLEDVWLTLNVFLWLRGHKEVIPYIEIDYSNRRPVPEPVQKVVSTRRHVRKAPERRETS